MILPTRGGALRDETKNGCVADYIRGGVEQCSAVFSVYWSCFKSSKLRLTDRIKVHHLSRNSLLKGVR